MKFYYFTINDKISHFFSKKFLKDKEKLVCYSIFNIYRRVRIKMVALTLAESLQLLCIDDYSGKIIRTPKTRYTIAGSIIVDLALENKITIVKGNKARIESSGSNQARIEPHNELLLMINNSWTRPVRRWVYKFGNRIRRIRNQLLASLEEKKIIERKSSLRKRYSIINSTIKNDMINTIRNLHVKDQKLGNYVYCFITLLRLAGLINKIPNTEFLETPPYTKENIKSIADDETRIITAFVQHEVERYILINNILTNVTEFLECCGSCADCA